MDFPSFLFLCLICASAPTFLAHDTGSGRALMSFKETPSGGNVTFDCSPSGPCIACPFSEKNDDKYRCSETGYRIPLKCVELQSVQKGPKAGKTHRRLFALENSGTEVKLNEMVVGTEESSNSMRQRSLLADSSTSEHKSHAYITYRSCVPAVDEEKLSVLGFEGIVFVLLMMSSSFVYFRRKQNNPSQGNGTMKNLTSSRF